MLIILVANLFFFDIYIIVIKRKGQFMLASRIHQEMLIQKTVNSTGLSDRQIRNGLRRVIRWAKSGRAPLEKVPGTVNAFSCKPKEFLGITRERSVVDMGDSINIETTIAKTPRNRGNRVSSYSEVIISKDSVKGKPRLEKLYYQVRTALYDLLMGHK